MAQGAAPLFLNTPAMTPSLNVGRAARYRSTGSCIQSALMVPVNIRMLLSLSPSVQLPTLNCILLLALASCHCFLISTGASSWSIQDVRKLGTRILLPPALLSKQQDSPQLPQWIVNPFRTTQAHQTRSVLFT